MEIKKNKLMLLFLLPFVILVIGFEILPLISVVLGSFKNSEGNFTFLQYRTIFTNKFYIQGFTNSLKISFYSSFVGIIVAVIGSYSISRLSNKIKERVLMLSNMTSNFAGIPLAFAFMILLGNNGIMTLIGKRFGISFLGNFNLYSVTGLIMSYIYFQIPLGILLLYPSYDALKDEWKEAATVLGASKLKFWRYIGIPLVLPSILGTFSILFANAMGAYSTAVALTSGNYNLLSIRIAALISGDMYLNPELASALGIMLGAIVVFTNLVNEFISSKRRMS